MSSSILSHMIFVIASIFLLFSNPNVATSTSSSSYLNQACNNQSRHINVNLCYQILQSEPNVVSATNLFNLSIAIMELGVSNATNTLAYIEDMLDDANLEPDLKHALQECNSSYSWIIDSISSALIEVRQIKEYQTASYDIAVATTDGVNQCQTAFESIGIKDEIILNTNKALEVIGSSADNVVEVLNGQSIDS